MSTSIVSIGGKLFQGFLSQLTSGLTKPNAKFLRHFLCGVLFSDNLVLTEVAAKVPCSSRLTATAKRFRRQLASAYRLQGKLLLIVGQTDRNVDPASTMQVANALIKTDRTFHLLVIPGGGHGVGGAYGTRKLYDSFVRHLLGIDPPDWNAREPDTKRTR